MARVRPIEKAQDIVDVVRHALKWIDPEEADFIPLDTLTAELETVLEFFGIEYTGKEKGE